MTINQVTDEELELYFIFLMKNYGVTDVQSFNVIADDKFQSFTLEDCLVETI